MRSPTLSHSHTHTRVPACVSVCVSVLWLSQSVTRHVCAPVQTSVSSASLLLRHSLCCSAAAAAAAAKPTFATRSPQRAAKQTFLFDTC